MPSHKNPDLESLWGVLDEKGSGNDLVILNRVEGDESVEIEVAEIGCGAAEEDDCYVFDDDDEDELIKQDLKRAMEISARNPNVVERQDFQHTAIRNSYVSQFTADPLGSASSSAVESIATDSLSSVSSDANTIPIATTTTVFGLDGLPTPTVVKTSSPASPPAAISTTATSSPTAVSSSSGTGLSTGAKLGLGIGLGVGIPLLVALLGCIIFSRRRKRHRNGMGGKYTPQGHSDVSMVESPIPPAAPQSHHPPEMEYYEPPKSFEPATYHAFSPSQDYEHYETPVSAVTPLDPQSSHSIPEPPPPLIIPTTEEPARYSHYSMQAPVERDVSPISPVSAVSAVSSMRSRSPSPRQLEH